MAGTRIETEFAALGADGVVRAFEQHDAALVRSTEAARQQSAVQSRQATLLRQLRDAEREEQQQLKQAAAIIDRTTTAEERYDKEIQERKAHLAAGRLTQEQYNRAVGDSKARLDAANSSNKTVVGSIAQTAAAIAGVTGAVGALLAGVRLLKLEYDQIVTRQKQSANSAIPFEKSVSQAVRNTVGVFTAAETRQQALDLARATGIDPSKAAEVVGATTTATGVQNASEAELALQASRSAIEYDPSLDAETIANTGAIAASLSKKFGITPQAAIGFVGRAGQQSNVLTQEKLIKNLGPTVPGLVAQGFGEDTGAALFTTLTQLSDDSEGDISKTGAFQLAASLRKRFRDNSAFQNDDGSFDAISAITYLQQNEDARRAFLDGTATSGQKLLGKKVPAAALGKGQLRPFIEQILTGGTAASRQFAQASEKIGTFDEGAATFADVTAGVKSQQQVTRVDLSLGSAAERMNATNPEAITGAIRNRLSELHQAAGGSAIGSRLDNIGLELASNFGKSPTGALKFTIEKLEEEQRRLTTPTPSTTRTFAAGMSGSVPVTIPGYTPGPREESVAADLGVAIRDLTGVLVEMRDAARAPEPAAAQPFVPESVSNTERPVASELSAEGFSR